jgi:hypothetical protein
LSGIRGKYYLGHSFLSVVNYRPSQYSLPSQIAAAEAGEVDESLKTILSSINARLTAPLARSAAASVVALSCVAVLVHTFEGYGWPEVFLSEWFAGSTTTALLVNLYVAWRNRWILNSVSRFIAVPTMVIVAAIGFRIAWSGAQFTYNPIGVFEQRKWHRDTRESLTARWTFRLRASSDTSVKVDVRIEVESMCDHVDITEFYPVVYGPVAPSLSEVGLQSSKSRTWELDQFRQPAVVDFVLKLNNVRADANRCIVRELRM